jgi:hypothetical protein
VPRERRPAVVPLVLWPALLTLGVTLLRLLGERLGWSPFYFSRLPGGGLSPLGITWLAPLVGFYLGWRLERAGVPSPPAARALGAPAAALALGFLLATFAERVLRPLVDGQLRALGGRPPSPWPRSPSPPGRLPRPPSLAYVRGPRARGGRDGPGHREELGTHYDLPPRVPAMPPLRRWLWIALLPQTTLWVAWTTAVGGVFGALGWRVARRRL